MVGVGFVCVGERERGSPQLQEEGQPERSGARASVAQLRPSARLNGLLSGNDRRAARQPRVHVGVVGWIKWLGPR